MSAGNALIFLKAKLMAKVRRLLIEVIGDKGRWEKLALKVKQENIRGPAFQEEFARVLPDWPARPEWLLPVTPPSP